MHQAIGHVGIGNPHANAEERGQADDFRDPDPMASVLPRPPEPVDGSVVPPPLPQRVEERRIALSVAIDLQYPAGAGRARQAIPVHARLAVAGVGFVYDL